MNRTIGLTTYIWLLTVEASVDILESVKRVLFERADSATETRNPHLNEGFRILPPTAVR